MTCYVVPAGSRGRDTEGEDMTSLLEATMRPDKPRSGALGLDDEASRPTLADLQALLADHLGLYLAYKTSHWLSTGRHFRDLHLLFDEHADAVLEDVDPLAERIVMLGGIPKGTPSYIASRARVWDAPADPPPVRVKLKSLLAASQGVILRLRRAAAEADAAGDPGTSDLLAGMVRRREKEAWYLTALLTPEA